MHVSIYTHTGGTREYEMKKKKRKNIEGKSKNDEENHHHHHHRRTVFHTAILFFCSFLRRFFLSRFYRYTKTHITSELAYMCVNNMVYKSKKRTQFPHDTRNENIKVKKNICMSCRLCYTVKTFFVCYSFFLSVLLLNSWCVREVWGYIQTHTLIASWCLEWKSKSVM